ncbi:hypothetical protein MTO96_013102 [Rhipicephalus appendiculatus]
MISHAVCACAADPLRRRLRSRPACMRPSSRIHTCAGSTLIARHNGGADQLVSQPPFVGLADVCRRVHADGARPVPPWRPLSIAIHRTSAPLSQPATPLSRVLCTALRLTLPQFLAPFSFGPPTSKRLIAFEERT